MEVSGTYGKTKVKVVRVRRRPHSASTHHELCEVHAEVLLEGDFLESYTEGINSRVLPTDTVKNICYVIAKQSYFDSIEQYGIAIIRHLLRRHNHLKAVRVSLEELQWTRMKVDGTPHEHVFKYSGPEVFTAECYGHRDAAGIEVVSGVKDLKLAKTTQSGFEDFLSDEYTSLQPAKDRILCTSVEGRWRFQRPLPESQFHLINARIRQRLTDSFSGPPYGGVFSKSVQHTMYLMAEDILDNETAVTSVELVLPNIHHFIYDLKKFDMPHDSDNQIFFPTEAPSGLIKCKVSRLAPAKL